MLSRFLASSSFLTSLQRPGFHAGKLSLRVARHCPIAGVVLDIDGEFENRLVAPTPGQTARLSGMALSHRIPRVNLKRLSDKRRKEMAARLGGRAGRRSTARIGV